VSPRAALELERQRAVGRDLEGGNGRPDQAERGAEGGSRVLVVETVFDAGRIPIGEAALDPEEVRWLTVERQRERVVDA